MSRLHNLLSLVKYPSKEKIELIGRAYEFAKKAHEGQTRYSGDPYFNHVVETAKILAELGMGRRTISAGLLHDVLEDAGISEDVFEKKFGKEILFLVQGVTKLGKIRYHGEERHIESLRKFFVAMSQDIRVLIIKLADRLHNMRTLEHVPEHKRRRIAMETMEIYVPLAYRLGIRKLKREMEDLAFKYIDPAEYEKISTLIKNHSAIRNEHLEKFRKTLLRALGDAKITDVETDTRIKSHYSLHQKLNKKHRDIDKIYDIAAIRINVRSVADCYKVLGVVHGQWRPLPGRIKDYIAFPKPNGYQSLHTTIFSGDGNIYEIQIRTKDMHDQAEFGMASHVEYKVADKRLEDPQFSWFKQFFPTPKPIDKLASFIDEERLKHIPLWIKQLVDVQSYVTIPTEFIHNLKTDFFHHRMFIFDNTGAVNDLPVGSTPIDFAYAEDVEIGNHLYGAKVNGKLVHIDSELKNGDIVEIITRAAAHPNPKWLEFCKTTHAKRCIRKYLESQEISST